MYSVQSHGSKAYIGAVDVSVLKIGGRVEGGGGFLEHDRLCLDLKLVLEAA